MALKPQTDKAPAPLPASPAWGELSDPGQPVNVVRFECRDAAYSYPYHALARWVLKRGAIDELLIRVSADDVLVRGRGLVAVHDALDDARLRLLRTDEGRYTTPVSDTNITSIVVRSASGTN